MFYLFIGKKGNTETNRARWHSLNFSYLFIFVSFCFCFVCFLCSRLGLPKRTRLSRKATGMPEPLRRLVNNRGKRTSKADRNGATKTLKRKIRMNPIYLHVYRYTYTYKYSYLGNPGNWKISYASPFFPSPSDVEVKIQNVCLETK